MRLWKTHESRKIGRNNLEVKECKAKRKVYNDQVLAWKENKAKCFYLILSN